MMTSGTLITVSPEQLAAIVERAVAKAIGGKAIGSAFLSPSEVAAELGVSYGTVRNWEKAGIMPRRVGSEFRRADIEEFKLGRAARN